MVPGAPEKTFAIIVGIGKYDGIAPLRGPAVEARRFASWLLTRSVPAQNIALFLSPLDASENLPECHGVRVDDARSSMRSELMNRFKLANGEHLIVFWGGHGVIDVPENARTLAFADARSGDVPCLKVEDLLAYFRGADVHGFPQQTFIIDACASYFGSAPRTKELSVIGMPHHEPVLGRRQMWLLSADDGQGATNRSDSGGLFTKCLLDALERTDAGAWPPDFDAIGDRLIETFDALKSAGKTDQTPTIFIHKPRKGIGATIHGGLTEAQRAFRREWERLRALYATVFDRADIAHFTGRDWLTAELDTFLSSNDRGVFAIEANAGLGKSAVMAHLARTRPWPHHFVELTPGVGGIAEGLRSLSLQLVEQWNLTSFQEEAVESSPTAFLEVLSAACQARNQQRPGEKIVILVDALDESARGANGNFMGLPNALPAGAYLVVSHRPVDITLHVQAASQVFTYGAESDNNMADMRSFIANVAVEPVVAQVLRKSGYTDEAFVDGLAARCGGLWIYLKYIIEDIRRGKWQPLDMPNLPNGIWQYYAEHCKERSLDPDWSALQLPVLSMLAVVQEDASLGFLCELAGVADTTAAKRMLAERWQPFLVVSEANERHYRMYHASLREFLEGRIDRKEYTQSQRNFVDDLADTTRNAHARVAQRYIDAWGGIESGLSGLADAEKRLRFDGGYGYRHVLTHLQGAKNLQSLRAVLTAQRRLVSRKPRLRRSGWRGWLDRLRYPSSSYEQTEWRNVWYESHRIDGNVADYLAGISRVWRGAEERTADALGRGELAGSIATEAWCALVSATLTSFADNIRPALLKAMLKERVLTPAQGLTLAQKASTSHLRTASLIHVARCFEGRGRDRMLQLALNNFSTPGRDERLTQEVLDALSPDLPVWFQTAIVNVVIQNLHEFNRETIGNMPGRLTPDLARLLLSEALKSPDRYHCGAFVLAGAGGAVSEQQAMKLLAEERPDGMWQIALVRFLTPAQQDSMVTGLVKGMVRFDWPLLALARKHFSPATAKRISIAAIAAARDETLSSGNYSDLIKLMQPNELRDLLTHITRIYPGSEATHIKAAIAVRFAELRDTVRALSLLQSLDLHHSSSADAFAHVAPLLAKADRPKLIEIILSRDWPPWKARALEGFANDLTSQQLAEVHRALERIGDDWMIREALCQMTTALVSGSHQSDVLNWADALPICRGYAYQKLAPHISPAQRAEIFSKVKGLPGLDDEAEAYVGLATSRGDATLSAAATQAALAVIRKAGPGHRQSKALAELALKLKGPEREQALELCLEHLQSMIGAWGTQYLAERLVEQLATSLDETRARRLLLLASDVDDRFARRSIVAPLAAALPEFRLWELLRQAPSKTLLKALALSNPELRADALVSVLSDVEPAHERSVALTIRDIRESRPIPISIDEALRVLEECGSYRALKLQLLLAPSEKRSEAIERARTIVERTVEGSSNHSLKHDFESEFLPQQAQWLSSDVLRSARELGCRFTAEAALRHLRDRWGSDIPGECLPDEVLAETLRISCARGEIDPTLVTRLCEFPAADLHAIWRTALQISAASSRERLGRNLAAMTPIIHKLGGDDALWQMCTHMEDMLRWWP